MAEDRSEFHVWLCSRLKSLNLDEEVLGEYIVGILDGDDSSHEEKQDALSETMEGMMESPDDNVSTNIFTKWKEFEDKKEKIKQQNASQKEDILAAVVEKQTKIANNINKKPSHKIDEDVKKNLVAQYGRELDDDFYSSSDEEAQTQTNKSQPSDKGLFQNTNAKSVVEKEKEKRDKQKQESEDKKVKIKEDREKQKAKVEERKDKEKKRTQKGERRAR